METKLARNKLASFVERRGSGLGIDIKLLHDQQIVKNVDRNHRAIKEGSYLCEMTLSSDNAFSNLSSNGVACQLTF